MWLLARIHGAAPGFHERGGAWVDGALDVPRLLSAIRAVEARHEPLRTSFSERDGEPVQVIEPTNQAVLREVDVAADGRPASDETALAIARDEVSLPFDLERRPLWRVSLIRVNRTRHLVVLSMHHIISDGDCSVDLFFSELFAAYHRMDLPALSMRYREYASWQRAHVAGELVEGQLRYWTEELAGAQTALELPTDRPRPATQTFAGGTAERDIGGELAADLRALAQREGIALFALLLAGMQAVLHRYTGQPDILVGTPLPGRDRPGVEGLIGYFGNPVVVRGRFGGDPTFRDLVRQVHRSVEEARNHGDVSFKGLVERLSPPRDPSRMPIFQVLFGMRSPRGAPREGSLLTFTSTDVELPYSAYDLIIMVQEREPGLGGAHADQRLGTTSVQPSLLARLEYNRDLFDQATIARLLGHWETLLRGAIDAPERRVSELPLLSDDERRALLAAPRRAAPPPTGRDRIHERVQAEARRSPSATAVVSEGQRLAYAELDRRANQVAHLLRKSGVGPDVRVGVCMERSAEMIVALLGVLKAGGAYVPLDPTQPPERLAFMVEDADCPVLLTEARLAAQLPDRGAKVVRLDADRALLDREPDGPVSAVPGEGPENLAYIIYTSGSTGKPKGVMVTHHNVVRLFDQTHAWYRFDDSDVWTMFHSFAFDFSVWEIWGALVYGGRLVVVPYLTSRTPDAFYALLADEGVTVLNQTPSAFRQLIQAEERLERGARGRLKLRFVIFGGEALDIGALRPWWERHGDESPKLVNMYGITETTVHVTYRPLARSDLDRPWSSVIGQPIPDLGVYILDQGQRPVPIGVPGEIYVGGAGVARGYLNRPELTAKRFIQDPFSAAPDARLYRSGDLARYLPSGDIEYLGRIDHQVKIRGFRIELGEIEAALTEHAAVREAVVLARADGGGDKRLVAYIVPDRTKISAAPDVAALLPALRGFLQGKLPDYMIPAVVVPLDALPLTTNGKIDRAALPDPGDHRPELARAFEPPRTATERSLADIWQAILRIERIGVHDNFFELGGHSLHAVRLFSRVCSAFGREIKFQDFFGRPTIAELATLLDDGRAAKRADHAISPVPRGGPLPLSFGQERLWFLQRLSPQSRAYNCLYPYRLKGRLDIRALDRSVRGLVRRHEILRTTYAEIEGRPAQLVSNEGSVRLDVVDLQHLSPEEREAETARRVEAEAQTVFDLDRGPLFRAGLLRLDAEDHILWLHFHHLTMDGWSTELAFREIGALYECACRGVPAALPELKIQYADFAAWQREHLKDEALSALLAWWRQRLADAPPLLDLPSDHARPAVQSFRGSTVHYHVPSSCVEGLRELGARHDMTLTMVLLTAFAVLLHRITHRNDIVIGMPSANRDRLELEGLMGFFVNTVPLRFDLSGDPSFTDVLRRVRQVCLESYEHDGLPFERLVQALRPERTTSYNPVVQVAFAPQPPLGRDLQLTGLDVRHIEADAKKTIFDVSLYSWESANGVAGMIEYSVDLFERATIERMLGHLRTLLSAVASDPHQRVSSLPMLTGAERRQLVVDWNDTAADFPEHRSVLDLFEEQARRSPHAVAVASDRGSVSYGDLDRRANQIADRLCAIGVGAETPVAIFAERSIELVVGVVAALKAGGAYVPFDPAYSKDRLELMLRDLKPPVLLAQAHLVERIPALFTGAVICLDDRGQAAAAGQGTSPPPRSVRGDHLAYVIFTSGSTGRPKGVLVPHRGLMSLSAWHIRQFAVTAADRATLVASPGFDASVWELWPYLCAGARVCIPGDGLRLSPSDLQGWLLEQEITITFLPTPLAEEVLRLDWPRRCPLRRLLTGGDKLSVRPAATIPFDVVNNYGPTEASVVATSCSVSKAHPTNGREPSIGRPIANTHVYILDPRGQLVPVGVPGELYIAGAGVARGYLNDPELTAARFLPDTFSNEPGARMYRTGDLVRFLPDGDIEFLGRADHQVKIRGFRIELGEVEAVLREHPAVDDAVVLAREDTPGNKRLVAYVIPSLHGDVALDRGSGLHAEHVSEWRALYDETYAKRDPGVEASFNVTGWSSSYTGAPIPQAVMRAWRDRTVDRILSFGPKRVWEIGCGTGLLLLQVAPCCAAYLGTDFSEQAISSLRPQVALGALSHVRLDCREAGDFTGIAPKSVDAVVLNSIIQYFPSAHYLRSVLEGAVRSVAHGGIVFVGDVRSLPLLEAFHASVQLNRAPPDLGPGELRARVERALSNEKEIVISPDYFRALAEELPDVAHAEIWLKRGDSEDEMTRYRYDVVLYVGEAAEPVAITRSVAWPKEGALLALERDLRDERPAVLEVVGIPNARVHADVRMWQDLDNPHGQNRIASRVDTAVQPELLWELGQKMGYAVRLTWSRTGAPDAMDALFERGGDARRPRAWIQPRAQEGRPLTALVNNPLRGRQVRELIPALREHLEAKLPDYMVPAAIVKLDALPLTANGKIDRQALPAPERSKPGQKETAEPTSDVEATVREIWRKVLDLDDVGLDDPFFELGGHSLLLGQVRAAVRTQLGQDVPMVDLFQYPTVRSLAAHLKTRASAKEAAPNSSSTFGATGRLLAPSAPNSSSTFGATGRLLAPSAPNSSSTFGATGRLLAPSAPNPASVRAEPPPSRRGPRSQASGQATCTGHENAVAIIGMAGRFPKARDVDALWLNLAKGVEGISFYTPAELASIGFDPELIHSSSLVPAYGVLEDALSFDAAFFGYSPNEAMLMDPQHRIFLECAWEAMERAGYNPFTSKLSIGVIAGSDAPTYWMDRVGLPSGPLSSKHYQIYTANVADGLTTRVAYKLGFRGPALTVLTACSTSLVAVHLGCQSLLSMECDMVLAGGAVIASPSRFGHLYEEGSLVSPDGHCRPYDADAKGTVNGSGVGIVVLKRLEDALRDGDHIHAVIRGSAVANDGSLKVGYTAPGLEGQFEAIVRAHAVAGVAPESIGYVEGHGTGTTLGDPIEVAALSKAFRQGTDKVGFCALGSVKSNLGHLGAAAGVTGLIKTALALEHELIPATLHFRRPNPEIDFENSPFFVSSTPLEWRRGPQPRRAGVSAFGIGGTNAHVVLEEAPARGRPAPSRSVQLLVLSARTSDALDRNTDRLAGHLKCDPSISLADAAFTLQQGRAAFAHRRAVVCRDPSAAAARLSDRDPAYVFTGVAENRPPKVVFMFPGGGAQRVDMGRELYATEPVYRENIDRCAALFERELRMDVRALLYPDEQRRARAADELLRPSNNFAAIFSTEYALAQLLMSWSIQPAGLTGHSLGEYTAACIADVLSLDDAVRLIAARARVYEQLPDDTATLIVPLSEHAVNERLRDGLSLAAVNGPETCVVSGRRAAIEGIERDLSRDGHEVRRMPMSLAAHSSLIGALADSLTQKAAGMKRSAPRIPVVSNLTGGWMSDADAQDASYWARHLRGTVRFADGLAMLLADPASVLIEVGPGRSLASLAARHPNARGKRLITSTLSSAGSDRTDLESLLAAVGQLWCAGVELDWSALSRGERRRRVPLPTYAFKRDVYVLDAAPPSQAVKTPRASALPWGEPTPPSVTEAPAVAPTPADEAAPAADPVARELRDAFREVLGVADVRPHDNFFDIGGTSLTSIELRAQIRDRFSVELPVHALLETRTFAALAERIRRALPSPSLDYPDGPPTLRAASGNAARNKPDAGRLVLTLNDGAPGKTPLFLIQPIGGTIYTYVSLSQNVDPDLPMYGIRASGMEPGEPVYEDIPSMASRYVEEIRAIRSKGPCYLGGHSAGGVIAYEVAQQLLARGQDVPLVIMMDSPALSAVKHTPLASPADFLREMRHFQDTAPQAYRSFDAALQDGTPFSTIVLSTWQAMARYEPRPMQASILYMRAQEQEQRGAAGARAGQYWMDLAQGTFAAVTVPGNHFTMMDPPQVASVVRVLEQHLAALKPRRFKRYGGARA